MTDDEIAGCIPAIGCADVVLVQLENNLSAIEQVVAAGRASGAFVVLNPAPWQQVDDVFLSNVDLLTPNATEAWLMTGCRVDDLPGAEQAAEVLHSRGAKNVIITLGANGALLSEQGVKTISRVSPLSPVIPREQAMPLMGHLLPALPAAMRSMRPPGLRRPMPRSASKGAAPHLLPDYEEALERLVHATSDVEVA
ncbi:Ribokinase [Raoultella planticola]|uniref:Ribokinase n=1 Tax=Raoultella planticola TaxID=575 RepID=A0A485CW98_RAOPL|nr:Ribokinase [Raoultella planticola]